MRLFTAVALLLTALAAASPARAQEVSATQRVAGSQITALASRALRSLPADSDSVAEMANPIPDQVVPIGNVTLTVAPALVNASFIDIPVAIAIDGVPLRSVYVGYRVVHFVRTAVAAHDLAPGSVLTAQDVRLARVPFVGHLPNGTQVLVGRRIYAAVTAGKPIYIDQTQTDQIVKAGSTVMMVVRDGGVVLVADVVARTGGGLGDQVSVYNNTTNKQLSGTVVGPGRVELDIDPGDQLQ
jgi:flagella basal body P-ring formation protein FlgA